MAETFDANSFNWSSLSNWGIPAMVTPQVDAKLKVFGTLKPEGFDTSYLNSAVHYSIFGTNTPSRLATQEEYEKAFQKFKDDPAEYYKFALKASAGSVGHTASLYDYFGGQVDPVAYKSAPEANYTKIATDAFNKGYLDKDEILSLSEPAYQAAYSRQSGYNNPDLRSGSGLFGKTLGAITSNPISTLAFPLVAAAGLGAFSGAGAAGGADYLGAQALGDATTGAVGSGSTGFGINAGASGVGINAGTGSLLASAPIESGFGISTTAPAGNFGEFNPNIGSGVSGSSGIGIDTGAATEGYLGVGSASDAASKSGLGYLGGAEALPTGTAGISTNVPASDSILDKTKRLSDLLKGGQQQQQSGFSPYALVKGLTDGQQNMPIGYNMNQNPFTYTQQLPIQSSNSPMSTTPSDLSGQRTNLASLLRNQ
jgi:hypothetical protein